MNDRDSEYAMGLLIEKGFQKTDSIDKADVILFNTCSVRKHAEDRAISNMGMLLKRKHKNGKIYGIMGCSAQALKELLFKSLPDLDIVCGPGEIYRLPHFIDMAIESKILACDNIDRDPPEFRSTFRENKKSTHVSIMRGCNNFCSYCIVPYVRGHERSRKPNSIINEVKELAKRGFKEVMLLGQNVNSYEGPTNKYNFAQLLKDLNKIDGIEKIKFMTSHPKDASVELFKAIKDLGKLENHLHLPLQSGSDRILKLMNRSYAAKKYTTLIKQLRELLPNCDITTDIIVGFPTESEDDFKKTYNLMKEIKFNAAYIFKYSPRPPAKAAALKDDVPEEIKKKRHKILLDLQKKISKGKI